MSFAAKQQNSTFRIIREYLLKASFPQVFIQTLFGGKYAEFK